MTEAGLRGSLALTDINVGPPTSCTCRARALPGSRVAFQACSSSGGMPWACAAAAHQTASTHTAIQTNHCRLPRSEPDRDCSNIMDGSLGAKKHQHKPTMRLQGCGRFIFLLCKNGQ